MLRFVYCSQEEGKCYQREMRLRRVEYVMRCPGLRYERDAGRLEGIS